MLHRPVTTLRSLRRASAAGVAVALLLAGCSDAGSPSQTQTGSAGSTSAATGSTSSATAGASTGSPSGPVDAADGVTGRSGTYSVLPPSGWGEATDEVGAVPGIDLVLMSSEQEGGFNTNLVVHVASGDAALLESELAQGRDELADQGRSISAAPDITVGGLRALGFTTTFSQQGIDVRARSYGLHRDGRVYLLTLSSATSAAAAADAALADIVESWTWT